MKKRSGARQRAKPAVQQLATVYHEAGHALAFYRLDFGVEVVKIGNIGDSAGRASSRVLMDFAALEHETPDRELLALWHDRVICLLAGREAQRRFKPHSVRPYQSRDDMDGVDNILCRLHTGNERRAVYRYLQIRARNLVSQKTNWRMIQDLAHTLIEKLSLTSHWAIELPGKEAEAVFRASVQQQLRERREQFDRADHAAPSGRTDVAPRR